MAERPPNTGKRVSAFFAQAGEYVVCPNGHQLYRLRRTMLKGDVKVADFRPANPLVTEQPDRTKPMSPCPECGAEWWRTEGGALQIHFKDGWRP